MIVNALLVRWADGYISVVDATSVAAIGRREAYLSVGNALSTEEATRAAEALLARYSTSAEDITAAIEPVDDTDRPYIAFGVGDTVTVPDSSGVPVLRRVSAITVVEDDDGVLTYVPELRA
jgi:hypothetical protein